MRRHTHPERVITGPRRRGFSLLEALVAAAILGTTVFAVSQAITTTQQIAFEGQKRVLASIAADDLLNELMTLDYATLRLQDGRTEPIGGMVTYDGRRYMDTYWCIGREVEIVETMREEEGLGVRVRGLDVTVRTIDEFGDLAVVTVFVPEPV